MSHSSLPRLSAVTALTIACLLTATPLAAQENSTIPSSPAQGSVQAQDVAPPVAAPETPAAQAPTAQPMGEVVAPTTGASDTAASPAPAPQAQAQDTPSTAPTVPSAPDAATTETAPTEAAPTEPAAAAAPADPAAVTAPMPQPTQAPAGNLATPPEAPSAPEPAQQTMLPQVIADALGPLGPPSARDPNLPHDLSPMGMFWAADIVVKGVMLGLIFASIITWTILVAKLLELGGALKTVQSGIRRIERSPSLPAALAASGKRRDPVSRMIRASATEYDQSAPALDVAGDSGLKERVDSHLDRIEAVAGRRMGRGTGVLATIGSTAPFVGLFGTVWGIMNSFIGISESQTTNLAVVAPGIAEALLATAIGLVAAIPAVVIYNVFARAITGYRLRLANASAGVRRLVSRDLDFRGAPAHKGV